MLYVLDGKSFRPAKNMDEFGAMWFGGKRHVAKDIIGEVRVSTVFLGLDHGLGDGPPLLFETMIFGGQHDQYQTRASSWTEAEGQHAAALALVTTAADS